MDLDATEPDVRHHAVATFAACPACGSEQLVAVAAEDEANFLCEHCGRCWHIELARISRVDPVTCPGCPHRSRCVGRLRQDEPDLDLGAPLGSETS